MRLVLDTNVLVAAFVARGQCHDLLEHVAREHELWTSEIMLSELDRVLHTKLKIPAGAALQAGELLRSLTKVVEPSPLAQAICRDPDDDWILATAVAAEADALITGDADLLVLESFEDISILAPAAFWAWEDKSGE